MKLICRNEESDGINMKEKSEEINVKEESEGIDVGERKSDDMRN